MNPSSSFTEATRRAFDNVSLELQKSTEDVNFVEELEEFHKIMNNNDVDEEEFYKYLEFEHEDEDCTISTFARNYSTHVIGLANYLTEVEFSDPRPSACVAVATRARFFLRASATCQHKRL